MLYNLFENRDFVSVFAVALLAEGVDRNRKYRICHNGTHWSPSSRRAWIEIYHQGGARLRLFVALLAEGVDRNDFDTLVEELDATVALLAEGVDRNRSLTRREQRQEASPSSRRAWIEMCPLAV